MKVMKVVKTMFKLKCQSVHKYTSPQKKLFSFQVSIFYGTLYVCTGGIFLPKLGVISVHNNHFFKPFKIMKQKLYLIFK